MIEYEPDALDMFAQRRVVDLMPQACSSAVPQPLHPQQEGVALVPVNASAPAHSASASIYTSSTVISASRQSRRKLPSVQVSCRTVSPKR